jgi:hypothetical protein
MRKRKAQVRFLRRIVQLLRGVIMTRTKFLALFIALCGVVILAIVSVMEDSMEPLYTVESPVLLDHGSSRDAELVDVEPGESRSARGPDSGGQPEETALVEVRPPMKEHGDFEARYGSMTEDELFLADVVTLKRLNDLADKVAEARFNAGDFIEMTPVESSNGRTGWTRPEGAKVTRGRGGPDLDTPQVVVLDDEPEVAEAYLEWTWVTTRLRKVRKEKAK